MRHNRKVRPFHRCLRPLPVALFQSRYGDIGASYDLRVCKRVVQLSSSRKRFFLLRRVRVTGSRSVENRHASVHTTAVSAQFPKLLLKARGPGKRRTMKDWPSWRSLIGVAAATFLLAVIGLNFVGAEKHILKMPEHLYGVREPEFERVVGSLLGPSIMSGNRIETLVNGDEIFPAMLGAIQSAEHTLDFETYVYWSGETGRAFAKAIAARVRSGVRTHVLLDWVGSQSMDKDALDLMRVAGARVEI
jgi:hypothetical protein